MVAQSPKACVIGLDGMSLPTVRRLMAAGDMPTLASLCERGAWGELRSLLPPLSPAVWTTICSGVSPGKHGVLSFTDFDPQDESRPVISSGRARAPQLWDFLAQAGRQSLVLGLPHIYPAFPIAGTMVTGLLTPHEGSEWCHPAEAKAQLAEAGLGFRRQPHVRRLRRMSPEQAAQALDNFAEHQAAMAGWLLTHRPWDLAFIVFGSSDLAQHALLGRAGAQAKGGDLFATPAGSVLKRHFATLDRLVGDLLALLPEGVPVVVVSDHGFGTKPKHFYLNEWLARQGLLYRSRRLLPRISSASWRRRSVGALLQQAGLGFLARWLPEGLRGREVPMLAPGRLLRARGLDWPRTRAFSHPPCSGTAICLNLPSQVHGGHASESPEAQGLVDSILGALRELKDPLDGQPVVDGAWRTSELYAGDALRDGPAILIQYRDAVYRPIGDHSRSRDRPLLPGRCGYVATSPRDEGAWHTLDGMVIAAGPGIAPGEIRDASVMQIAPTVLALMGFRPPSTMEGRPLPILRENHGQELQDLIPPPSAATESIYSAEDEETVMARLEDLGYL